MISNSFYKLVFFVPSSHCDNVKEAVFSTGAGSIGNYRRCSWQILGEGQFEALEGSTPFIGVTDEIEYVEEYRVELVCSSDTIRQAVIALLDAHPYETPAYDIIPLASLESLPE